MRVPAGVPSPNTPDPAAEVWLLGYDRDTGVLGRSLTDVLRTACSSRKIFYIYHLELALLALTLLIY